MLCPPRRLLIDLHRPGRFDNITLAVALQPGVLAGNVGQDRNVDVAVVAAMSQQHARGQADQEAADAVDPQQKPLAAP